MAVPSSGNHLLNSWKEIANYLGRGVRTVQRWEKIGLPIRRLGPGSRPPVLADPRDLDRWVLGAAHVHGITTPQSSSQLVFRGQLIDSVQQARRLRDEMTALRESHRMSVLRLTESLAKMEKVCFCLNDSAQAGNARLQPARGRDASRSR